MKSSLTSATRRAKGSGPHRVLQFWRLIYHSRTYPHNGRAVRSLRAGKEAVRAAMVQQNTKNTILCDVSQRDDSFSTQQPRVGGTVPARSVRYMSGSYQTQFARAFCLPGACIEASSLKKATQTTKTSDRHSRKWPDAPKEANGTERYYSGEDATRAHICTTARQFGG